MSARDPVPLGGQDVLTVDDYGAIRRARRDGMSIRQVARTFHHTRRKIRQVLAHAEPAPCTRTHERPAPVLGPFRTIIDQILADDEQAPPKQRHTAMQVFRRLRDEHGYPGGYGQVQRHPRRHRTRHQETFIPLGYLPGQRLEADFGHIHGDFPEGRRRVPFLVTTWAYSNAPFVLALPFERTEAIIEGRVAAFESFGSVPREVWWDDPKTVATFILQGRGSLRVRAGQPLPLRPALLHASPRQRGARRRGHRQGRATLPGHRFDPCVIHPAVPVDKYQTVAFDTTRYSVPRPFAFRMVTVKGYVDRVVIVAQGQAIARTRGRRCGTRWCSTRSTTWRRWAANPAPGPRAGVPRRGPPRVLRRVPGPLGRAPRGAGRLPPVRTGPATAGRASPGTRAPRNRDVRTRAPLHAGAILQRTRSRAAIEAATGAPPPASGATPAAPVHVPLPDLSRFNLLSGASGILDESDEDSSGTWCRDHAPGAPVSVFFT